MTGSTLVLSESEWKERDLVNTKKGDTLPDAQRDNHEQLPDFAHLYPANRVARIAFSEVVESCLREPGMHGQVLKYMHYENADGKDDRFPDPSDSESFSDHQELLGSSKKWSGYFRFNLDVRPRFPQLGWIAGSGLAKLQNHSVDFKLVTSSAHHYVQSRHVRFLHNEASGCLMVVADGSKVKVRGSFDPIILKHSKRALTEATSIYLGDLEFFFKFTDINDQKYHKSLQSYMRNVRELKSYQTPIVLSTTGSDTDMQLRDYTLQEPFSSGAEAQVYAVVEKKTGLGMVLKRLKATNGEKVVEKEKKIAAHLTGNHPNVCSLHEVITRGSNDNRSTGLDDVFLIYKPILLSVLDSHISEHPLDEHACETVCRQLIDGLAWIHQNLIIHRDIKPANMGMQSFSPPVSMIFDFGHSTTEISSTDHYKGTVAYLAPEVLNLKYRKSTTPYTNAVDTWSLGISISQLILHKHWPPQPLVIKSPGSRNGDDYSMDPWEEFRALLNNRKQSPLVQTTLKMIEENPSVRITSRNATRFLKENPAAKTKALAN